MKEKSEAFNKFQQFKKAVEKEVGKKSAMFKDRQWGSIYIN